MLNYLENYINYLHCLAGGRSEEAAAILKRLGFKYIYDLIGGYSA
jgi:rhodanese-related sulfurtransferase